MSFTQSELVPPRARLGFVRWGDSYHRCKALGIGRMSLADSRWISSKEEHGRSFACGRMGAVFGNATLITFPVVGASGVSHPLETIQLENELPLPDLVSIESPQTIQRFPLSAGDPLRRHVPNRHSDRTFSIGGEITRPTRDGPRHAVIHGDILVSLPALSGATISQLTPPLSQNSSDLISNLPIVPKDQAAMPGASFAAAEVLVPSPNQVFNPALVYASNHNTGTKNDTRGDSIAVLSLAPGGALQIVNQFFTGLHQVRGMQFGGTDDRFPSCREWCCWGRGRHGLRERWVDHFLRVANKTDIPNFASFVWV